jgi:Protein of unknown function (DUF3995)
LATSVERWRIMETMSIAMRSSQDKQWAAYGAGAWAFAFAAVSGYWALGGELGSETIAADIARIPLANDPVVVWATAGLKALAGLLALALVRPWGRSLPRWVLVAATWSAGLLLTLYGGASLVDHGLMVAGLRPTPALLGEQAARWHLALWDPVWLLGGVLFLAAARQHRRRAALTSSPCEIRSGGTRP